MVEINPTGKVTCNKEFKNQLINQLSYFFIAFMLNLVSDSLVINVKSIAYF